MSDSTLSHRGRRFLEVAEFLSVYSKYLSPSTKFHAVTNPQGCISLAAAETTVFSELIAEQLNVIRLRTPWNPEIFGYENFTGIKDFKVSLAGYFSEFIVGGELGNNAQLNPDLFTVTNGAGSALESLVSCLCDPGDYVMIPTPMYHGLVLDVEKRFGAKILPVPMTIVGRNGAHDYEVDLGAMTAAWEQVTRKGKGMGRVRAFIHCNPHNPTGKVFHKEITRKLLAWCVDREIHFISDELYARSELRVPGATQFVSALRIARDEERAVSREAWVDRARDFVHLVYSFSKDIGLNGFRAGVIYTENSSVFAALDSTAYFTSIPTLTQVVLASLLADREFMRKMIDTNAERATALFLKFTAFLNSKGIETFQSTSGMFIWANVVGYLDKNCSNPDYSKKTMKEKEISTWERQLAGGVCALPSYVFQPEASGWFRICFTTMKEEHVFEGLRRLIAALDQENQKSRL